MACKLAHWLSLKPPMITDDNLKKETLNLGAVEMLNLVLGFSMIVGNLVPEDDPIWPVFILMRQVLIFSCGLKFSSSEISFFQFSFPNS